MRLDRIGWWLLAAAALALVATVAAAQDGSPQDSGSEAESAAESDSGDGDGGGDGDGEASPLERLPVVRETLDNGLRVVLSPKRDIPTVAIAVYYDVGSRNEERGRSGFAHLFEHMMFQGSAHVDKGQHFQLIMNRGGRLNGSTTADRTNYFETLPANELELGLWLEADRMSSLAVTEQNFENQRETVKEERRQRVDNQPYVKSMIRINEMAYGDYWPYAHPTIGYMQALENAPLSAVQDFFDKYYAPNNAVLAIAGDIDPDEAIETVRKYFGDIEPSDVPEYDPSKLPPQTAERKDTMIDEHAELPAFHIAYHIPPKREPDHYALELLATILGGGDSSRLYQKLVKQKEICQKIQVSTDGRRGPDLFSFWSVLADGHKGKEARKVIYDEISRIAEQGVSEQELKKAKNRMRSQFIFGLQSNLSRAMELARFELFWGDATLLKNELDHYLEVTEKDIKRVAGRYFDSTNRTVLDVLPASAANKEGKKQ
jgi:predicted Zn-dependent peptidase